MGTIQTTHLPIYLPTDANTPLHPARLQSHTKMSILGDPNEARGSIHSALNQNEDENEFSQVLEELKAGAEALKNIGLLMEVVKQKASGAPIDDKTLLVSNPNPQRQCIRCPALMMPHRWSV